MVILEYLLSEEEAPVQLKLHVKCSRARGTASPNALELDLAREWKRWSCLVWVGTLQCTDSD